MAANYSRSPDSINEHFIDILQPYAQQPWLYSTSLSSFTISTRCFFTPQDWTVTTRLTSAKVKVFLIIIITQESFVGNVFFELCIFVFFFSLKHLWTIKCCNCASHWTGGHSSFLKRDGSHTQIWLWIRNNSPISPQGIQVMSQSDCMMLHAQPNDGCAYSWCLLTVSIIHPVIHSLSSLFSIQGCCTGWLEPGSVCIGRGERIHAGQGSHQPCTHSTASWSPSTCLLNLKPVLNARAVSHL